MQRDTRTTLAGLAVLAIALGIGRFVLTPLLPLMREDAGLDLVTGGWLASLNNLGYLVGALACAMIPLPQRKTLRVSLVVSGLLTLGMGLMHTRAAWLLLRGLAGIASVALMVHGIAFGLSRMRTVRHRRLESILFTGPGVGIMVSGLLVAVLQPFGLKSATAWVGFGLLTLATSAAVWRVLATPPEPATGDTSTTRPASGPAWALVLLYALLGFGYVIPATFLPVIAEQHLHLPALREWFWPLYGSATVSATLLMPHLPAHWTRRDALGACCTSMGCGVLLCIFWPTLAGLALGTVLIGSVTMPVVLLVMGEARALGGADPTRLIATLTAGFSIGQIAGPLLAAWLAERLHGFAVPLAMAAVAIVAAGALTRVRGDSNAYPAHSARVRC